MADLPKKKDHQYIIRNCIANFYCTILPFIEIIGFVWKKVPKISLEQYFNSFSITKHVGGSKKAEKIWRDRNKEMLKKDSFETCDVTFLYTILPIICRDKIVVFDTPEHKEKLKDKSTVEWHLKQIKEMRNSFSHQRQNISSKDSFTKLKDLIRNCLIAACKLYEITNQVEIDKMTDEADEKFDTIIRDIASDRQSRVIFLKDLILLDCIDKMKEKVENMNISLPGNSKIKVDLSQVFKNIYLRDSNASFECRTLLAKISKKINIIEGRSGSGKTTLLKNVQRSVILGKQSDFESCNKYRLALLISCQTNNETHLGDYCKALLPDIFATFDKDEVLDSIRLIDGVLFLIDGYDEVNDQSRKLTNSAIEFCSNSGKNASCIISSRIKAANRLTKHLDRRNLDYNVITIDKIEDQNIQTNLISSYGEQLPDVNKEEAVSKFISLNQKVKDVFNTPLLLAFFSTLYKTLGNDSQKIKEVDVFRGIYRQILDGIYEKIPNGEDSASTIMDIISKHCLHVIGLDKTVFIKEEYEKLKASCKSASPTVVNMDYLLENVLLPKIPDNILHVTTYNFIHLSIHEFFASLTLEEKLKKIPGVISRKKFIKILDLSPLQIGKNIERYQNVFRFLVLILHSTGEIKKIGDAMSEIMARDIKPDIPYCLDLISDTEHDDAIIKMMSAAVAGHSSFAIDGVSDLKSLVQALYLHQNKAKRGTNDLNISQKTKSLALNMRKSHEEYEVVVDDIFVKLKKIKCTIILFRGCLVTEFSLNVLASKLTSNSRLYISCPSAISHSTKILEGKTDNVNEFTFKYCDDFTPGDKNPLPRTRNGFHSRLYITDMPAHSQEHVFDMICGLAPTISDERFYTFARLYLLRCFLSRDEVVQLVVKLSAKEFTTYNEGVTMACKSSSVLNEYCVACRGNHTEENRTCYEIQLSKSDYVRHLDLICAADFSETAIKREEPAVKKHAEYRVKNINHLTALIKVLNYSQQSSAHSSRVDGNETKSGEKAEKTKVINIEILDSYRNFQPLSDCIFQDLQPVRCNIVKFIGCIDSSFSLKVLNSKLIKTSGVLISRTTVRNHQLNILNSVEECILQFMFKYEGESLGDRSFPLPLLPSGHGPILRVTDTPADSLKTVCSFISSLAPVKFTKDSITFFRLFLARCSLTDSEAEELAKKLSAKNLLTENEGVTRALKLSPARTEFCEACNGNHKENNVICYQLQLAK